MPGMAIWKNVKYYRAKWRLSLQRYGNFFFFFFSFFFWYGNFYLHLKESWRDFNQLRSPERLNNSSKIILLNLVSGGSTWHQISVSADIETSVPTGVKLGCLFLLIYESPPHLDLGRWATEMLYFSVFIHSKYLFQAPSSRSYVYNKKLSTVLGQRNV